MRKSSLVLNIDELRRRYEAGETLSEIGRSHGVTAAPIRLRLVEAGVSIRSCAEETRKIGLRRMIQLDGEKLHKEYEGGISEQGLAAKYRVSRQTIRRHLVAAGATIRGVVDAIEVRVAQFTPEDRKRMARVCRTHLCGHSHSDAHRQRIAKSKESSQSHITNDEILLADGLRERGLTITPQKAIDRYNVDLGIEGCRIALDVFSKEFAKDRHCSIHFRQRSDRIIEAGWLPLNFRFHSFALAPAAIDAICELANQRIAGKLLSRPELTLRSDGKFLSHNPQTGCVRELPKRRAARVDGTHRAAGPTLERSVSHANRKLCDP